MAIARHYIMESEKGNADALLSALTALVEVVEAIPGCESVTFLQDVDTPHRFVFIERWASIEAHKQGGSAIPKDIMDAVMGALAGRPAAAYMQYRR